MDQDQKATPPVPKPRKRKPKPSESEPCEDPPAASVSDVQDQPTPSEDVAEPGEAPPPIPPRTSTESFEDKPVKFVYRKKNRNVGPKPDRPAPPRPVVPASPTSTAGSAADSEVIYDDGLNVSALGQEEVVYDDGVQDRQGVTEEAETGAMGVEAKAATQDANDVTPAGGGSETGNAGEEEKLQDQQGAKEDMVQPNPDDGYEVVDDALVAQVQALTANGIDSADGSASESEGDEDRDYEEPLSEKDLEPTKKGEEKQDQTQETTGDGTEETSVQAVPDSGAAPAAIPVVPAPFEGQAKPDAKPVMKKKKSSGGFFGLFGRKAQPTIEVSEDELQHLATFSTDTTSIGKATATSSAAPVTPQFLELTPNAVVDILDMGHCPSGTWICRAEDGTVGYIYIKDVKMNPDSLQDMMNVIPKPPTQTETSEGLPINHRGAVGGVDIRPTDELQQAARDKGEIANRFAMQQKPSSPTPGPRPAPALPTTPSSAATGTNAGTSASATTTSTSTSTSTPPEGEEFDDEYAVPDAEQDEEYEVPDPAADDVVYADCEDPPEDAMYEAVDELNLPPINQGEVYEVMTAPDQPNVEELYEDMQGINAPSHIEPLPPSEPETYEDMSQFRQPDLPARKDKAPPPRPLPPK
eukprot:m.287841 g.287841  ORF g.287841 m.287841 type:complete len:639 (-) comp15795_c3_seq2:3112-5028(-)